MGLKLSQRGPVGFGLPFIKRFKIGLWVRGWKGFGFCIRQPEGTGLRGLWVLGLGLRWALGLRLERALGLNIGLLEGRVCVWA